MKLIAAVDHNWGIGKNGTLLASVPEDMRFFRESTKNKVLVMGHKTLLSLPNHQPLKGRLNIVLSNSSETNLEGCIVCNSVEQLLYILKDFSSDDIMVIGGGLIFRQMLPYCSKAYITKMKFDGQADAFMPNLDEKNTWYIEKESNCHDYNGLKYSFIEYSNNCVQQLKFRFIIYKMSSYFINKDYIDIDYLNFRNGKPDYTEERYLVELRDLLHAYFRPLEFGFHSLDILHFIEDSHYLSFPLEEYLRYKRYIASDKDFELLFTKYNPNKEIPFTSIRIKKEELDSFENCIDSFMANDTIIDKFIIS